MSMRNLVLPVLVAAALGPAALMTAAPPAGCAEKDATPLALGAAAPMADTRMLGVDGREATIAGVAGPKGTLVVFSCNHCPWVKAWEPRLVEIGNGCAKKGIGVIVINPNDPKAYPEDGYGAMKERAGQRGMTFPYVVDATSDVARAFGATRTPEAFLFDGGGKLVYHGAIDDNAKEPKRAKRRYLKDAVRAVAAGKQVAVKETKALGCSIKFRGKGA